jgi:hypothetical protein
MQPRHASASRRISAESPETVSVHADRVAVHEPPSPTSPHTGRRLMPSAKPRPRAREVRVGSKAGAPTAFAGATATDESRARGWPLAALLLRPALRAKGQSAAVDLLNATDLQRNARERVAVGGQECCSRHASERPKIPARRCLLTTRSRLRGHGVRACFPGASKRIRRRNTRRNLREGLPRGKASLLHLLDRDTVPARDKDAAAMCLRSMPTRAGVRSQLAGGQAGSRQP